MPENSNNKWTPEEDARLKSLIEANTSIHLTAAEVEEVGRRHKDPREHTAHTEETGAGRAEGEGEIMAPRMSEIPQYRERAALQSVKNRSWVPQMALLPAGEGTITSMIRKGWLERQIGPGGMLQFRITEAGKAAIAAKIPTSPSAR